MRNAEGGTRKAERGRRKAEGGRRNAEVQKLPRADFAAVAAD
jgi:hypothetical protein